MMTLLILSYLVLLSYGSNLISRRSVTHFYQHYLNIGGPVARAAGMLRDEWDQVMHED